MEETMEETTVKKISTVSVTKKTCSKCAIVYQCTTCQSIFIDMYDNYFLCPFCGRKIIWTEN